MQSPRSRTLVHGAIGGLAAGLVVAIWFLIVDLAGSQPFRTPALLASAVLGETAAIPTPRLVAVYTLLHFSVFVALGIAAALFVRASGMRFGLLLGAVFGLGVLDAVHYGALLFTGARVLDVLPPLHVLAANLVAGMVMMAYLHRAMGETSRLGLGMLRDHPLLNRGIVTGLVGAGSVALWFLLLDVIRGAPFFTPAALGSVLFFGAASPSGVQTTAAVIAAYTAVHVAIFAVVGVALEWSVERMERAPGMWVMALLVTIMMEALFLGVAGSLSAWVLGAVGYWAVLVANLISVIAMGTLLWRTHPVLRESFHAMPAQRV
ncbi:MAG: hypothetical protein H7Z74_17540 [Anaerolineae bacterium]|nr:hypothetical protein [Gemmatimonadaceae bacterium]